MMVSVLCFTATFIWASSFVAFLIVDSFYTVYPLCAALYFRERRILCVCFFFCFCSFSLFLRSHHHRCGRLVQWCIFLPSNAQHADHDIIDPGYARLLSFAIVLHFSYFYLLGARIRILRTRSEHSYSATTRNIL